MKKTKNERPTSTRAGTARRAKSSQPAKALSLSDLEVPVERLLTREEEWRAGRRVRSALRRIAWLLPRHPDGYRRFLARMEEVADGGGLLFTWLSLREKIANDLEAARAVYADVEKRLPRQRKRAVEEWEKGAKLLESYPLDPEHLFNWAKETIRSPISEEKFATNAWFQKLDRVLRRAMEILERERDRLVLPNFRLVLKDVFRYHPTGMRHSDLFQEGVLGLHKAVFRFDPERATRFSTYATYWIRQAIRKALIDKSRMIRVPQAVQEELRKEDPSLKPDEADRVRRIMSETMLFSAGDSDDGNDRNSFVVSDPNNSLLDESLHTRTIPTAVSTALEGLDTRSREVVQRRFGLAGDQPQTLEEIGKLMSLSRERIRQIEREALQRMKLDAELQEVYEDLGTVQTVGASRV